MAHDYKKFPELSNTQIDEFGFTSPHKQITEDFDAKVVKVHDGDTVTLTTSFRDFKFPLRFLDIDSKELNEGGKEAQQWLENQVLNQDVQVQIDRNNRVGTYGRLLGRLIYRGQNMGDTELMLQLAVPFGKKYENKLPNLLKDLSVKKWLTI